MIKKRSGRRDHNETRREKPWKWCAGAEFKMVGRKLVTQTHLLLDRTRKLEQQRSSKSSPAGLHQRSSAQSVAAAGGVPPEELQRRTGLVFKRSMRASNPVSCLLWSHFRATCKSFEYDWQLPWLFAFPSCGLWNFNQNYSQCNKFAKADSLMFFSNTFTIWSIFNNEKQLKKNTIFYLDNAISSKMNHLMWIHWFRLNLMGKYQNEYFYLISVQQCWNISY